MKAYLFLSISFIFSNVITIYSQEVAMYGQRSLWHAENLCDVNFTDCDYRVEIGTGQGILGYAYYPNGELWLVTATTGGDYRRINIYSVEIESCTYTNIHSIPLPKYWSSVNAVNIDFQGRIYIYTAEHDTVTNKSMKTLSRINIPESYQIQRVLEIDNEQRFWEIHFLNQKIYLVDILKPYIYVYDEQFNLLDTIITSKHIWGLTSISMNCDSVITYATHMGISTEEYRDRGYPDTMMYISKYDLEANALSELCQYWMGNNVANTNLTSPLEFLSSDPECDLLIDLDRDNSSGVFPYDFLDSIVYCNQIEIPITDEDVYVHTSAPLDSIRLIISGIHDFGHEQLVLSTALPGVSLNIVNDSTYVLISALRTDSAYTLALEAIQYVHDGLARSAGTRHIVVQGFNAIKDGVLISATIFVDGLPYAGHDASLLLCTDTLIQSFSSMTSGDLGGFWWPDLQSGNDEFNSYLDTSSLYYYIVADPECGNDTAQVIISRDSSEPVDILGGDQTLCPGDSIQLEVNQPSYTLYWDDGSTNPSRILSSPGSYWVSLQSGTGCTFIDTLQVNEGLLWSPLVSTVDPVCGEPNGEIIVEPIPAQNAVFINQQPLLSTTFDELSEGTYHLLAISADGCSTEQWLTLIDQPFLEVEMDSHILVVKGLNNTLTYLPLNQVDITDVLFEPADHIRWTGSAIEVMGDKDREYEISFMDANGCIDAHVLHVTVEAEKGIYLPNIFSPRSTSGNDIWAPSISENYRFDVLRIYDRWGNMVYQSTSEATWNGRKDEKECQSGVFVFQLVVENLATGELKVILGDFTLLR